MKKSILLAFLLMIIWSCSYGQFTATLANRTASPNDTVKVAFRVTGFTNVNSFTFYINIDPSVLTFMVNQTVATGPSGMIANLIGNQVRLVWSSSSTINISNGNLLYLVFTYNGLSSPVDFIPSICEVTHNNPPVIMTGTYTNGSVSPYLYNTAKAKLDTLKYMPLGNICDTLRYTGFASNVQCITQKISYDPNKLTFINVTGTGNLSSGFLANITSPGIITIEWTSTTGKSINYPSHYFKLNFSYINASATNIGFSTGCVIGTTSSVPPGGSTSNIKVTYFHGYVTPPLVITSYATVGNNSNGIQGQIVDVPVTFQSMPSNTTNFNLKFNFDSPRLSYIGVYYPVQPVISNINGNTITITNANMLTPTPSINGVFCVLRFQYNGVGTAGISFGSGCQFSTNTGPIGVGYTNGSVSPGIVPNGHNTNIAFVTRTGAGSVNVPVYFNQMPNNIGAITLFMNYDASKLTYTSVINPYNAMVKVNGNLVTVAWSSGTAFPTDTIVKLQFNYVPGAGSSCAAPITFTDGSQISSTSAAIIPTNWTNGGVNVKFKISGTVKYNSDPMPRIPLTGHKVKLLTVTNDSVTSGLTDATGSYQMWAPNGSYHIVVSPPNNYTVYSDIDDAMAIFDHYMGYPIPLSDVFPLRLVAGDVNQNGEPDIDDAMYIFDLYMGFPKSPAWTAPDWIYQTVTVNCNCDNVPNVHILGLNSGNVLGTNPTP